MGTNVKVLVIAGKKEALQCYESLVKDVGAQFDAVDSLQNGMSAAIRNSYNGLLIDIPTVIQARDEEKKYLHDLLEVYPVGKVRISPSRPGISLITAGKCIAQKSTVEEFITECTQFKARTCRSSERRHVHLPVTLSSSADFAPEDTEKTFTVNLSHGGCFVFSLKPWKVGDNVVIAIHRPAGADTILIGEVRWTIPWGTKEAIPGIGIRFRRIPD
jgi:hypothetical protein